MSDFLERLNRVRSRPSAQDLLGLCIEQLGFVVTTAYGQARFDFCSRFAALRDATQRCETERALTLAEELEQVAKRDDLFLGRYPVPKDRELLLVRSVLHELGELSDDRLYGAITDDAILHAVDQVKGAWQLYTDASSGFFRQDTDQAG